MQKYFLPANSSLQPNPVIIQFILSNDFGGFGKHGFDFYQYNRARGLFLLNHSTLQKVLLFEKKLN
jgi:hypothetical protein